MLVTMMQFDLTKDRDKKDPIPVTMFAEVIAHIELGLYVRWMGALKRNGKKTMPLGNYINKKIKQIRGNSYSTKEEMLKDMESFSEKYGIEIEDYIKKSLQDDIERLTNEETAT